MRRWWRRRSRSGGSSCAAIGRDVDTVEDTPGECISVAKRRELTFEGGDPIVSRELVCFGVRRIDSEHELPTSVLIWVSTMPLIDAMAHFCTGKVSGDFAATWEGDSSPGVESN